jgi:hypothetical protein
MQQHPQSTPVVLGILDGHPNMINCTITAIRARFFLQDLIRANEGYILNAEARAQPLRAAWATWNSQRAAQRALQARIVAGELSLEEVMRMWHEHCTLRGGDDGGGGADAATGGVMHAVPFQWPSPKPRRVSCPRLACLSSLSPFCRKRQRGCRLRTSKRHCFPLS